MEIIQNQSEGSNFQITDHDIEKIISTAIELHPQLRGLKAETFSDSSMMTLGFFRRPKKNGETSVIWVNLGVSFEKIMSERKTSVQQVARKLRISEDQMTPRLLKIFIIAHETGHAQDYSKFLRTYGSVEEANKHWVEKRDNESYALPIPCKGCSSVINMYHDGSLAQYIIDNKLTNRLISMGIDPNNLTQVIERQQIDYKDTTAERDADEIAMQIMKKYSKELGLDLDRW